MITTTGSLLLNKAVTPKNVIVNVVKNTKNFIIYSFYRSNDGSTIFDTYLRYILQSRLFHYLSSACSCRISVKMDCFFYYASINSNVCSKSSSSVMPYTLSKALLPIPCIPPFPVW